MENDEETKVESTYEKNGNQDNMGGYANSQNTEKKGFCITSMILGITSLVGYCIPFINMIATICGICAIIFGVMGKKRCNGSGKGMATAGIVMGIISVVLCVISLIIVCVGISAGISGVSDIMSASDIMSQIQ